MRRRLAEPLDRAVTILGGLAVIVAVFGTVVYVDSRDQRAMARDFLARGVPSVADDVVLLVKSGRGGTYIDEVAVAFPTADARREGTLVTNDGDPEGAKPGRRTPRPDTRYATPLPVLYLPHDQQVIATVDARFFANDETTPHVALGMIAGGLIIAIAALFRHGVPPLPKPRKRPPRQPPRHNKP
ncbi:hypothetical protein [Kribbella speibonae]|uniref:DUF3592 domain-containing protein n=1 Tax=Kribbella speibonae TaxID=1572660 RepID=A0ABY2AD22_9ACTN|nr:hypothetical protein [Kribbella speibonae]TCC26892.1 hypothetical protein E0H58_02465 [Kribbella speibonae]